MYAIATGVTQGWLDRPTYGPVVDAAWAAVAATVAENGTVAGICCGVCLIYSAVPVEMGVGVGMGRRQRWSLVVPTS